MTPLNHRRWVFVLGLALLLTGLVAGSTPRRVGDAGEYLAMTMQLSKLRWPAMTESERAQIMREFTLLGTNYESSQLDFSTLSAGDGRQDLPHFWFYSLMAVPFYWLVSAVGAHPNFAFALLNLVLLLSAAWVLVPRVGWPAALFALGSPIIWWVDKAHTEVFTFALLAIAMALIRDRPQWSVVLAATAATQNPPIGVAVFVIGTVALLHDRSRMRQPRFWLAVALALGLSALHPLYYLSRLGALTPQRLSGGVEFHLPSLPEVGAYIWDANLGLFPNFPLLLPGLVLVSVLVWRARAASVRVAELVGSGILPLTFVLSFAQTTNVNSGGTPGLSRYAVWLVPLAVPLLVAAHEVAPAPSTRWLAPLAALSCAISLFTYHPMLPDHFAGAPTPLAAFLWSKMPSLEEPLVEVFVERLSGGEQGLFPIATLDCAKILYVDGRGVERCSVAVPPPPACAAAGTLCYADHVGDLYRFAEAPPGTNGHAPRLDVDRFRSDPLVSIDAPGEGRPIHGIATIAGWTFDRNAQLTSGIQAVLVYLDAGHRPISSATLDLPRPDVGASYGDSRFGRSGWRLLWDTTAVSEGEHVLTVVAYSSVSGRAKTLERRVVVTR